MNIKSLQLFLSLLFIIFVFTIPLALSAETKKVYYADKEPVFVYTGTKIPLKEIGRIKKDTIINVVNYTRPYYKINFNGKIGYVHLRSIRIVDAVVENGKIKTPVIQLAADYIENLAKWKTLRFWVFFVIGLIVNFFLLRFSIKTDYHFAWEKEWDEFGGTFFPYFLAFFTVITAILWAIFSDSFVKMIVSFQYPLYEERYFMSLFLKFAAFFMGIHFLIILIRRITNTGLKKAFISVSLILFTSLLLSLWLFIVVKALIWVATVTFFVVCGVLGIFGGGSSSSSGSSKGWMEQDREKWNKDFNEQKFRDPFNGPREQGMWGWKSKDK